MTILGVDGALWGAIGCVISAVTYGWAIVRGMRDGLWDHGPEHSEHAFPILLQASICTGIGFAVSTLGVIEMPFAVLISGIFFASFAGITWTHWKHRAEWPSRQKDEDR